MTAEEDVLDTVRRTSRLRAYADLFKFDVPELWLGVPVGLSTLPHSALGETRTWSIGACAFAAVVGVASGGQALDDVQGHRDGTDEANYRPGTPRRRSRKPLLDGRLTEHDALVGGIVAAALAGLATLIGWWLAGFNPWWAPLAVAAGAGCAIQYSFGASFSYRLLGGGEAILAVGMAAACLFTEIGVRGQVSGAVVLQATVLGLAVLQVSACSSTHDAPADRAADRRTVASVASVRVNLLFVQGLIAANLALFGVGLAVGAIPWWSLLGAGPGLWGWTHQLILVRRERWLEARRAGFTALRWIGCGLIVGNLLAGW